MIETVSNQKINTGGFGAHESWESNLKKAKRDGLESCGHCGKGMVEGTGWEVRIDMEYLLPLNDQNGRIVRVGNSCVNNWKKDYPEFKDTHFAKVGVK
jgi:hypothetical protein